MQKEPNQIHIWSWQSYTLFYLQCHGNLDKPLHHLILRQKFALLLFKFVIQISSLAEAHNNIQQAVFPLPGLSVGDYVRMFQLG